MMDMYSNRMTSEWFFPYAGRNEVESDDIALRYRTIVKHPFHWEIDTKQADITCCRDILYVKYGQPDKDEFASFRGDSDPDGEHWLVRSDSARGLQVRGFLIRVQDSIKRYFSLHGSILYRCSSGNS